MHSMTLTFDLGLDMTCLDLDMTKIYFLRSDLDFGVDMSKNVLDDL